MHEHVVGYPAETMVAIRCMILGAVLERLPQSGCARPRSAAQNP